MPAPKNPVYKTKPCAVCGVTIQDNWSGTKFYCQACSVQKLADREKARGKARIERNVAKLLAKGPGICVDCGAPFERNKNDMRKLCDGCQLKRRRAKDSSRQKLIRKTPAFKNNYRDYSLKRNYGITLVEFEQMLLGHGGGCAICRSTEPGWSKGWHVDHNHQTGVVRGVLCHRCNLMIGLAKERPERLRAAASYLENSNQLCWEASDIAEALWP